MRKYLNLIAVAILCLATASCVDVDPYLFVDTGMATYKDGTLVADSGIKYIITEDKTDGQYKDAKRMVYSGYAIEKVDEKTYNMRLTDYAAALYKECVVTGKFDEEVIGNDPVSIAGAWYGGGCLNLNCHFLYVPGVKAEHTFDLEYDDVRSNSDTVYVRMHHNAHEEGDLVKYELKATEVYTYASFPCEYFFPAGKDKIVLSMNFTWFPENTDMGYEQKKREYTVKTIIEK